MPPLRRRRKFANGRVSGSRASPALSTCTACSSGAPMCGVPSETLCLTSRAQSASASAA